MPDIELNSIGLCESSSIAIGYDIEDAMLKAANVQLILARTICSGKYMVVVGGDVSDTAAAVDAGKAAAREALVDARHIPRVHPDIFPAVSCAVDLSPEEARALGIIESFSASSIIEAADAAAKAADIRLFRIHMAMAIGGKGFCLLTGDVAAVESAVAAGAAVAEQDGVLVATTVIPGPRPELFSEYI